MASRSPAGRNGGSTGGGYGDMPPPSPTEQAAPIPPEGRSQYPSRPSPMPLTESRVAMPEDAPSRNEMMQAIGAAEARSDLKVERVVSEIRLLGQTLQNLEQKLDQKLSDIEQTSRSMKSNILWVLVPLLITIAGIFAGMFAMDRANSLSAFSNGMAVQEAISTAIQQSKVPNGQP